MEQQPALFDAPKPPPKPKAKIPEWIAATLDPSPASAAPETCRRCTAVILAGRDHQYGGQATADPTRLDPAQELAAIAAGRPTLALITEPGLTKLMTRHQFNIRHAPANTCTVLPAHKCGQPIGTPIDLSTVFIRKQVRNIDSENPPF